MSIGAVLDLLLPDFPDHVSVSKIRFLEAEGLITPNAPGRGIADSPPTTARGCASS
jgi:DNA-binding transcriptional MerR regulator